MIELGLKRGESIVSGHNSQKWPSYSWIVMPYSFTWKEPRRVFSLHKSFRRDLKGGKFSTLVGRNGTCFEMKNETGLWIWHHFASWFYTVVWVFFTNCSVFTVGSWHHSGIFQSIGFMCKLPFDVNTILCFIDHWGTNWHIFAGTTMVDRELDDNNCSEDERRGWKGARCIDVMGYRVWK